ncbi:hypothetical protein XENOCAPTIV_010542 [Xenoophorus captivus]|uniref:Uncharacterized protein n=2 Tax=Goodeidae TaxID=28758 RepID=A0ABV0Q984_9TELE
MSKGEREVDAHTEGGAKHQAVPSVFLSPIFPPLSLALLHLQAFQLSHSFSSATVGLRLLFVAFHGLSSFSQPFNRGRLKTPACSLSPLCSGRGGLGLGL